MDIGGTDSQRTLVRVVGAHSPGAPLVGLADEKGWSPCRRYRPLSPGAPSDLFWPHLCRVCNRHRERKFFRTVGGRYFDLGLLHKGATGGTLLAGGARRRRLRCVCTQDRDARAIHRPTVPRFPPEIDRKST